MTSLPTRLTAERLVEIRNNDKRVSYLLSLHPVFKAEDFTDAEIDRRDLLDHVAALEGELAKTLAALNDFNSAHTEQHVRISSLEADLAACGRDESTLRRMLAFAYSAPGALYGDDGELQDSQLPFPIDYVRDTVKQIETAIYNRGMAALAKAQADAALSAQAGTGETP